MTTYTEAQVRANLAATCYWAVTNHGRFSYSEGPQRMEAVHRPYALPIISDCSAWITSICSWNGLTDPNGMKYNGSGYTGTLLSHNKQIDKSQVQPGDIVVYGPGTGAHTAMIVGVDVHRNMLSCSMGQNGDPSYVWVNAPIGAPAYNHPVDGRQPQRFLRLNLNVVGAVASIPGTVHTQPDVPHAPAAPAALVAPVKGEKA